MLPPEALLFQADRLLLGRPDEADLRRAISGFYYAVFHLLTFSASEQLAPAAPAAIRTAIRRSFDHRGLRRVCDGMLNAGKARSKLLSDLLPADLPNGLTQVASAFVELQSSRLQADYDLEVPPTFAGAKGSQTLAHTAFENWNTVRTGAAAQAFLVALHLADRLTRRG